MLRQIFGGPLLTCAVLAAALGVSYARRRDERRRQQQQQLSTSESSAPAGGAATNGSSGKYFCVLSAEAIKLLIATNPLPRCLIDVRPDAAKEPLPPELAVVAVAVPEPKVAAALAQPGTWAAAVASTASVLSPSAEAGAAPRRGPPSGSASASSLHSQAATLAGAAAADGAPPTPQHLVVFLDAADDGRARRAAAVAAAMGFDRTAVIAGGLEGYFTGSGSATGADPAALIGRDALAALLGRLDLPPPPPPPPPTPTPVDPLDALMGDDHGGDDDDGDEGLGLQRGGSETGSDVEFDMGGGVEAGGPARWVWQLPRAVCLDVRRHDERALYGAIPGALHVPADELSSALSLAPPEFSRRYHFERPPPEDLLVLHSRTTVRAHWAARVAHDAGYCRLLVLRGGAYSWRADGVEPYPSYQTWEAPPDPEPHPGREPLDPDTALEELLTMGLLVATAGGTQAGEGGAAAA